jgi:tetratricopeptide (TPR) repeat protein
LVTALALQGQYTAALHEYRRALELNPDYQLARENMERAQLALDGR